MNHRVRETPKFFFRNEIQRRKKILAGEKSEKVKKVKNCQFFLLFEFLFETFCAFFVTLDLLSVKQLLTRPQFFLLKMLRQCKGSNPRPDLIKN